MIYLNGKPVPTTVFPDNTSQVWRLPQLPTSNYLRWEYSHEGEFLQLAQLRWLLYKMHKAVTVIDIPYLPYARQDKPIDNRECFALHTFAKLFNMLSFQRILIQDPHSLEALALINNSEAYYPARQLDAAYAKCDAEVICYPDEGATRKYRDIYPYERYITGIKSRNPLTGLITSYDVVGNCQGKRVLIVDDICDGGATFINLAGKLYGMGATSVNLFITHGLFSKGVKGLFEKGIQRIFTAKEEITRDYARLMT